jgi:hypothetical protein
MIGGENMAINESTFDDKVHGILSEVAAGKSRAEVAKELGYKSYMALDRFMQKKNYEWNKIVNSYVPISGGSDSRNVVNYPVGRVATIFTLMKKGMDLKEIATQLKFDTHHTMAEYMLSKGYVWDEMEKNYGFRGNQDEEAEEESSSVNNEDESAQDKRKKAKEELASNMESYLPLLSFLKQHEETLQALISAQSAVGKIPRYILPGIPVTKSVHMNYGLDQLVREFSQEKNISQRDIFEVALVGFFKKYGYHQEVDTLLGS